MTAHGKQDHPVANPDRTVLEDDRPSEKLADEIKKAVDNADGPLT